MRLYNNLMLVLAFAMASMLPNLGKSHPTFEKRSMNRQIDSLLSKYHDLNRLNGGVMVAKNGKILLSKGYGNANMEWNVPNTPDTKYMLASVSKTFTATLVMRLVDEGKLGLDTKLSDVLPWYRRDTGEKISIFELLNHTSGIPNYMNLKTQTIPELNREFGTSVINKIAFAKKYCQGDLEFEPGTRWNYNNSAYFLLGLIAEQVTGKPFEKAMQEWIFQPLKMTGSGDLQANPERVVKHLATGYIKTDEGFQRMHYWNLSTALGAGSLYSTMEDMLKYDQAIYSDGFLSVKARSAMFTPGLNGYGCGWELRETPLGTNKAVKKIQTHEGFLWAWHTRFYRIPEDGYCIVIISNAGDSPLEKMFTGITDLLYGREPEWPKPSLGVEVAKKYKTEGIDAAIAWGKSVLTLDKDGWESPEKDLNAFGYRLLQTGLKEDAVKLFKWNTELNPKSWNAWDSYGEGLDVTGQTKAAIEAYQISVKLNPENKVGAEILNKIKSR